MVPADKPAMVSTSAGERRTWFSFIREVLYLSYCSVGEEKSVMTKMKLKYFSAEAVRIHIHL